MPTLQPRQVIGKYRIIRQLGRGGTGVVYLAEDETLGRDVALKVLDHALTSGDNFEERFRQEARLIAGLKHPNIIQIHSLETLTDGSERSLAIDMEYVEGGSLADVQVSAAPLMRYVHGILDALACCHASGIVHRDVKPSNILLAPDGRALLSDFGLAKLLADHHTASVLSTSSSGLFVGTPRYAPPESWDTVEPAPTWDVYSIGMTVYEALAGKTPYDAESPFGLIKQMLERPVPPLCEVAKGVSPELSHVVVAMLDREPSRRPQDAGEALRQLQETPEYASMANIGQTTVTVPKKLHRRKQRISKDPGNLTKRKRLRLLAGVLLILAGLTALALTGAPPFRKFLFMPITASTPFGVYDTIVPASQETWKNHLLMCSPPTAAKPAQDGKQWTVIASESTRIWWMTAVAEEKNAVQLEGFWAEFTGPSAQVFRHGTMDGRGQWVEPNATLTFALDFRNETDGSRWQQTFLCRRNPAYTAENLFLAALEASDYVQPILYNELVARARTWVNDVEALFSRTGVLKTSVPYVTPSPGITLDGKLGESAWRITAPGQDIAKGTLEGRPAAANASLSCRYDDANLYLGFHIDAPLRAPRLLVNLMDSFSMPLSQSPFYFVQMEQDAVVASSHVFHGRQVAWTSGWKLAHAPNAQSWEAEVAIPFTSLDGEVAPVPFDRWRIHCSLFEGKEKKPLAEWGNSSPTEMPVHGDIIVFGVPAT